MNRVDQMFAKAKEKNEACLMNYLPSTGPDFARSKEVIAAFVEGGCDYIELSVPGNKPWLDGTPMQMHHLQSGQTGIAAQNAVELGAEVRAMYPELPILPMGYVGDLLPIGLDNFVSMMAEADLDGMELPDYPSYSACDPLEFHKKMRAAGLYNINFCDGISLAEEGTENYDLLKRIVTDIDGFLFLTATPGVTGAQGGVAVEYLTEAVARIRVVQDAAGARKPIMVGFGLSTPDDVRVVVEEVKADAVVVGSAVSRLIHKNAPASEICDFVRELKQATIL